jgi:hypothetical protein
MLPLGGLEWNGRAPKKKDNPKAKGWFFFAMDMNQSNGKALGAMQANGKLDFRSYAK